MSAVLTIPNEWTIDPLRKFTHPMETLTFYMDLAKFKKMGRQIIERTMRNSDEALNSDSKRRDILALLMKEFREEGLPGGVLPEKTIVSLMNEIVTFL